MDRRDWMAIDIVTVREVYGLSILKGVPFFPLEVFSCMVIAVITLGHSCMLVLLFYGCCILLQSFYLFRLKSVFNTGLNWPVGHVACICEMLVSFDSNLNNVTDMSVCILTSTDVTAHLVTYWKTVIYTSSTVTYVYVCVCINSASLLLRNMKTTLRSGIITSRTLKIWFSIFVLRDTWKIKTKVSGDLIHVSFLLGVWFQIIMENRKAFFCVNDSTKWFKFVFNYLCGQDANSQTWHAFRSRIMWWRSWRDQRDLPSNCDS